MKTKRIIIIITVLGFISAGTVIAQPKRSHESRLPWVDGTFPRPPQAGVDHIVSSGMGRTLSEARTTAQDQFIIVLGNLAGATIDSRTGGEIKSEITYDSENVRIRESSRNITLTNIERGQITVSFIKVGEYYEHTNGMWHLWELYQVSMTGNRFTPFYPTYKLADNFNKSKANALSFVPFGAAQFYKGNRGMGTFFLAGQAVTLGSAGLFWKLSDNYYADFLRERNPTQKAEYKRLSETTETLFYVSLGVAGGLYVWQIFHGLFADSKRKEWRLTMAPYATPQSHGLALSFRF